MFKRKIILITISALMIAVFAVNVSVLFRQVYVNTDLNFAANEIKNMILLVGDGMGENHIDVSREYKDAPLYLDDLSIKGYVNTTSLSGTTDSAAAGTAMSAGVKVNNGNIARYAGEDLTTIMQVAKENGKKTGVITSDSLYGATVAAFSASVTDRSMTEEIIEDQINSELDLLIGKNSDSYDSYSAQITNAGYDHVINKNDLDPLANKVFATLPTIYPSQIETEESVNLTEVTDFALNFLDNENGFVLVIESAGIDKKSHANELQNMIYEMLMLDETLNTITNWMGASSDTFVMVTGDHETGDLKLNNEGEYTYNSTGHTNVHVPYYTINYNPGEELIDNIDIFKLFNFFITGS